MLHSNRKLIQNLKILFCYVLTERESVYKQGEKQTERERERARSRLPTEQGAQRGAQSQDPGIMT